jgi:hypothetical protein
LTIVCIFNIFLIRYFSNQKSKRENKMNESDYRLAFEEILNNSALNELEKVTQAFDLVTRHFITHYQHDAEVAQALGDKTTAVREQIKAGVLQSARGMYQHCYQSVTGSRETVWHE